MTPVLVLTCTEAIGDPGWISACRYCRTFVPHCGIYLLIFRLIRGVRFLETTGGLVYHTTAELM
jgi:hypothetical protein